ncbi:hypothetical protein [Streptomyces sp. NBC_01320]|uniref:hypothetical protein n=1 Tax=Streptomyces sp. NBC_01320 TaxID=2903824 RepID=UPI002E0E77B6|nr:hypothetical protein OG395_55450 [Streptomyces sp. NBC_01320]
MSERVRLAAGAALGVALLLASCPRQTTPPTTRQVKPWVGGRTRRTEASNGGSKC